MIQDWDDTRSCGSPAFAGGSCGARGSAAGTDHGTARRASRAFSALVSANEPSTLFNDVFVDRYTLLRRVGMNSLSLLYLRPKLEKCRTPKQGPLGLIWINPLHELGVHKMTKKSKRRAWTTAQVRTLKTLAKRKTKAASIARTLRRSEGATRQKALSIGLSLDSRV